MHHCSSATRLASASARSAPEASLLRCCASRSWLYSFTCSRHTQDPGWAVAATHRPEQPTCGLPRCFISVSARRPAAQPLLCLPTPTHTHLEPLLPRRCLEVVHHPLEQHHREHHVVLVLSHHSAGPRHLAVGKMGGRGWCAGRERLRVHCFAWGLPQPQPQSIKVRRLCKQSDTKYPA